MSSIFTTLVGSLLYSLKTAAFMGRRYFSTLI
jgi:hypothetical protein